MPTPLHMVPSATTAGRRIEKRDNRNGPLVPRDVDYGFDDRLLPVDAVMQLAGIGKTLIYRLMREGKFPQACKPGGRSTRWSEKEVKAWRDKMLASRG